MWHIIHCNALPKNYKETKENKVLNKQIVMATENEEDSLNNEPNQ